MSNNPSSHTREFIDRTSAELILRGVFTDDRGAFEKPFIASQIESTENFTSLKEVNLSFTQKSGTVRGFHFQTESFSESKIVTCVAGKILDVVIDVRPNSATYGYVNRVTLEARDGKSLVVPKGFAHGFQTLSDETSVLYCVDQKYQVDAQAGINPLSSNIMHIWPIPISEISKQDRNLPTWEEVVDIEANIR